MAVLGATTVMVTEMLVKKGLTTAPFEASVRVGDRLIANDPRRKVRELFVCALHGAVVRIDGQPCGGPHERVSAAPKLSAWWFADKDKATIRTSRIYSDGAKHRDGFTLVRQAAGGVK